MKKTLFFYLLLSLMVVTAAWLLAHPNLLGRIGLWLYKYNYLKTFPRALATVGLVTLTTIGICYGIRRWVLRPLGLLLLGGLFVGGLVVLIQTVVQFSSGTYAYTGAGFKTGAILLPVILIVVIGQQLWEHWSQPSSVQATRQLPN